jgi:hypothetical protein
MGEIDLRHANAAKPWASALASADVARSGAAAQTQIMPKCRARTDHGYGPLCTQPVKRAGLRCHWHKGLPEAGPRLRRAGTAIKRSQGPSRSAGRTRAPRAATATRVRRQPRQLDRVTRAAEFCADVVSEGWKEAAADRALGLVSDQAWTRLSRGRPKRRCKSLAEIAAQLLAAKQDLHNALGRMTFTGLGLFGIADAARTFAAELVSNLPLPVDAKIIAAARGLQITGIVLCLFDGRDLTRCQFFIDLALTETKSRVRKLLVAATGDWRALSAFGPRARRAA